MIGCEGNVSYYEVGAIMTPISAGFSVLGWNHPGFGESTGENHCTILILIILSDLMNQSEPLHLTIGC